MLAPLYHIAGIIGNNGYTIHTGKTEGSGRSGAPNIGGNAGNPGIVGGRVVPGGRAAMQDAAIEENTGGVGASTLAATLAGSWDALRATRAAGGLVDGCP